eukprot:scaffold185258_cov19-Tisochrysis_lutea.AAC.2
MLLYDCAQAELGNKLSGVEPKILEYIGSRLAHTVMLGSTSTIRGMMHLFNEGLCVKSKRVSEKDGRPTITVQANAKICSYLTLMRMIDSLLPKA